MLSAKEIADYVHGRAGSTEKQQFTFSGVTKLGDALIMRWHTLTGFTDGEPMLTDKTARTAKANVVGTALSRIRIIGLRKMSAMKRNILLIMLGLVVFAVTFVLESRHTPAYLWHEISRSNPTVEHQVVSKP